MRWREVVTGRSGGIIMGVGIIALVFVRCRLLERGRGEGRGRGRLP
jgi:hypothetical protein